MSLSKKILGSVAVAGLLWAGATAYISSNTEQYLKSYIEKTNKIYENNGMKMSLVSFEKGFLNSKAKLSVDFVEPTMREAMAKNFKLPMEMDYDIENGPLLFKEGLALGASRISSQVKLRELLLDPTSLDEYIQDDIVVDTQMLVDFSKKILYNGKSNGIVATIDKDIFTITPLEVNGKMDAETLAGTFKMRSKSISVALANGGKSSVENILLDADISKFFENGFYLGDFVFSIDNINIDNPSFPQKIEKAKLNMVMNINQVEQGLVNMNVKTNFNLGESKLPKEYAFLKEFDFAYGLERMKMEALMKFQENMQEIEKEQQRVYAKLAKAKSDEEQMRVLEEMQKLNEHFKEKLGLFLSQLLVKDKTNINANLSLLDPSLKKSNAGFNVKYVGEERLPSSFNEIKARFQRELLNWIAFNMHVNLQKSLVAQLPSDLQQQLSLAIMTGMLQENNSTYSFDANYVPKKLMINGQDRTEMLQLLEMTLGG